MACFLPDRPLERFPAAAARERGPGAPGASRRGRQREGHADAPVLPPQGQGEGTPARSGPHERALGARVLLGPQGARADSGLWPEYTPSFSACPLSHTHPVASTLSAGTSTYRLVHTHTHRLTSALPHTREEPGHRALTVYEFYCEHLLFTHSIVSTYCLHILSHPPNSPARQALS